MTQAISDPRQASAALADLFDTHKRVVFFGGAGVSTASGIPDFRSVDGLYHQKYDYPPETILSHTFWEENPEEFYRFYRDKLIVKGAKPNAAHLRLAKLEREGRLKAVVTQNIDGLHQAAGSRTVYELHGSTLRNYCTRCGKFYDVDFIANSTGVPRCTECGGIVKPDVVLYEEGRGRGDDGKRRARHPRGRHPHRRRHKPGRLPGGGSAALLPRGEPCCHQQAAHPGGRNGQSADPRSDWPHAGPRCPH